MRYAYSVLRVLLLGAVAYSMLKLPASRRLTMEHEVALGKVFTLTQGESARLGGLTLAVEFLGHHEKGVRLSSGEDVEKIVQFAKVRLAYGEESEKYELDLAGGDSSVAFHYFLVSLDAMEGFETATFLVQPLLGGIFTLKQGDSVEFSDPDPVLALTALQISEQEEETSVEKKWIPTAEVEAEELSSGETKTFLFGPNGFSRAVFGSGNYIIEIVNIYTDSVALKVTKPLPFKD